MRQMIISLSPFQIQLTGMRGKSKYFFRKSKDLNKNLQISMLFSIKRYWISSPSPPTVCSMP